MPLLYTVLQFQVSYAFLIMINIYFRWLIDQLGSLFFNLINFYLY